VLAAQLPEVRAAVCRELTKVHEEVVRGSLLELSVRFPVPSPDLGPTAAVRGEISLVLDLGRPLDDEASRRPDAAAAAERLLARGLSRRDTAAALNICYGMPRREADQVTREVAAR
jgi:16S rRNA (cytidine1402-2'-O)-methyltransferase